MLKILPCLDSEEMTMSRKRELDIPRAVAARLGASAVEAGFRGYFQLPSGDRVDWEEPVRAAREGKVSIPPEADLPQCVSPAHTETRIQVANETTLGASHRLAECGLKPLALNFANGVYPGGGFLHGARAQEEVLCRSSALYSTLLSDPMYEAHRKRPLPDSSDWVIYSPKVPVFRTDEGTELEQPWLLSFLTCAAPFAPTVGRPESRKLLRKRIHRVLDVSRAYGYETLVLGAWGCGAFGNDPNSTAEDFREALENEYSGWFSEIVFAVTDWSPDRRYLGPFRDVFQ
jgi:uncharacterized protein (TIGR02452 family)